MDQISLLSPLPHTLINNQKQLVKPTVIRDFTDHLPVEILGEIFIYCLDFRCNDLLIPRKYEAPMLLCRVCARWRHIATSMPILWASLSVCSPSKEGPRYASLIKFWIGQSRSHPLSFELRAPGSSRRAFQYSFPILLSEISRWHDATIELTQISCEQFLSAPLEGGSCLEALTLCNMGCTDAQLRRIPTLLSKFSRLRRLIITRPLLVPLFDIPWFQLTDIYLNTPLPVDECVEILNKCSRIVYCTLMRIRAPSKTIGAHIVTLSTLIQLDLFLACDAGEILSHLTCPALLHLRICHRGWLDTQDPKTFNEFLVRSSSMLETFHFFDEQIMERDLIQYISAPALQSLKTLTVHGLGASTKTLNLFKYDESGDVEAFMPSLEILGLDVEGVPDDLFADMVASRLKSSGPPTTLQEVHVWFRRRHRGTLEGDSRELTQEHLSDLERVAELSTIHGVKISTHMDG